MDIPTRIEVEEGERMVLGWEDGSTTVLSARQLRAACQCATCRDPSGREATRRVLAGDQPVRIHEAYLVGAYAINLVFTPDGHGTGIFSFDMLRGLVDPGPPGRDPDGL